MPQYRINTYTCTQGHVTVTRDVDDGVTVTFKNCPRCNQQAQSAFYQVDQSLDPTHEWYKPQFPERYANLAMRQHVEAGGLAFRAIGGPDETEGMKSLHQIKDALSHERSIYQRLTNRKR